MSARNLIPDTAIGRATSHVQNAQRTAIDAAAATHEASRRQLEARDARRSAPKLDAKAASDAIGSGTKPPHATLPEREADERAAAQTLRILRDRSREARAALHRAVYEDRRALIDVQAAAVVAARDDALELLGRAAAAIDATLEENAVLTGYRTADEYTVVGAAGKRLPNIGKLRFDVPNASDAELRAAISKARGLLAALEASTSTAGDYLDDEARKREDRRASPVSAAGAVVWGGVA